MRLVVILWVAAMIALIVGLDATLFKDRFWERLALNLGIVLVLLPSISGYCDSRRRGVPLGAK
jgi:predicted cobalt transporter CbtA